MIRVEFPLVRDGTKIVYPDEKKLFQNVVVLNSKVIADYFGSAPLTRYIPASIPRPVTAVELWDRFTNTEHQTLVGSNKVVDKVFLYRLRLGGFDLNDTYLINYLNAAEVAGDIGPGRAAEILA